MYKVLLVDDEALIREAISENIRWEELGRSEERPNPQGLDFYIQLLGICLYCPLYYKEKALHIVFNLHYQRKI